MFWSGGAPLFDGRCATSAGTAYPGFPLPQRSGSMDDKCKISAKRTISTVGNRQNAPSSPHSHQNLHLPRAFSFSKATRVDVGPKHATHSRCLRRALRTVSTFLRSRDERGVGDRRSLSLASSHGEQVLIQKFLRESIDLLPPPLRNLLSRTR